MEVGGNVLDPSGEGDLRAARPGTVATDTRGLRLGGPAEGASPDSGSAGGEAEAAAAVEAAAAEAGARPTELLPLSHLARISAYWLGLTAIDGAIGQFIGFRMKFSPEMREGLPLGTATSLVTIPGVLVGIAIQPTVGSMSDYAITRWGRRKPFIVIGSLLDLIFLLGIAYANTLLALIAFVTLLNFSTNFARGPFQGYVPDLVAEKQVGMASAMVGLMQILGNLTGFLVANIAATVNSLPLALVAVAIVELATMASVVLRVGKGLPAKPRHGRSWRAIAAETWGTDILSERSYVWLLASRLFFLMSGGILYTYSIAYLANVFGYSQEQAGEVNIFIAAAVLIGNVLVMIPASRLSDRIGRKPVIYLACLIGGFGVGVVALAPNVPIAVFGAGLYGAASGTFLAVDWALMTDIIPRVSAGRYMGLSNVATGSAGLLAAAVGGFLLDAVAFQAGDAIGSRTQFLFAVALYGVAAVLLTQVVEPRRRAARTATPPSAAAA